MKHLSIIISLLTLFAVTAMAVSHKKKSTKPKTELVTHERTVTVGEEFTVSLRSNQTTGYQWTITKLDPDYLTLMQQTYQRNQKPKGMVGVGGEELFSFKALKSGSTKIVIDYKRAWEKDIAPAQRECITVTIADKQ